MKSDDSNDSGTTDTDRSDRSDRSDNDDESPQKGEKSKRRSGKGSSHGNRRLVASHKSRRIGGRANPTPPLELQIFRKASDKLPYNDRLEVGIANTGTTLLIVCYSLNKSGNMIPKHYLGNKNIVALIMFPYSL